MDLKIKRTILVMLLVWGFSYSTAFYAETLNRIKVSNQSEENHSEGFMSETEIKLQTILQKAVDNHKVFGTSFCVKQNDRLWSGASGDLSMDSQFYIASATKLFVTAIIMNFRQKGLLNLNDPISKYLPLDIMNGLHRYKGKDYAGEITIRNLLAHTSGLPDYFQQKNEQGISLETELIQGKDQHWTFEQCIQRSKQLSPKFAPGEKGKANYSDTNFQLLGKIIEVISGKSFAANCEELIFTPLALTKTYLYTDAKDSNPATMYYKNIQLPIPLAMTSFGPDGGIVSTAVELQIFLEAFFSGTFFPEEYLKEMKIWNKIFFPMQAGIGIHMFKLPWLFNPTGAFPPLYGHSGLSGTFAYYSPQDKLFITGTVNQIAYPSTSFKLALKLIQHVMKEK